MTLPDFQLDPRLVRRRAEQAATGYASVDTLAREISRRMGERLEYIRIEPRRILDLGCGPGPDLAAFAERYPGVPRIAVDSAAAMLAKAFMPKGARVLPIATENKDHKAAGNAADARLQDLHWPPDLVWLGVGGDGHTAVVAIVGSCDSHIFWRGYVSSPGTRSSRSEPPSKP